MDYFLQDLNSLVESSERPIFTIEEKQNNTDFAEAISSIKDTLNKWIKEDEENLKKLDKLEKELDLMIEQVRQKNRSLQADLNIERLRRNLHVVD